MPAQKYLTQLKMNLAAHDIVRNPFHGGCEMRRRGKFIAMKVWLKPIYPDFSLFILMLIIAMIIIHIPFGWWYIIGILLMLFTHSLHSPIIYRMIFRIGLHKKGHHFSLYRISMEEYENFTGSYNRIPA